MIYFGINLTKYLKDRFTENCRTLLRKIKEDLNKWEDILCSWVGRQNIVKLSILWKLTHRFNIVSIKVLAGFLIEIDG